MGKTILSLVDITKTYTMGEVEVQALRETSLEVYEGEFVVILGPSGSGKSTLLNIIGGMDTPTSGELFFKDIDLSQADDALLTKYRREEVGFVFQFYNLISDLTALENVELAADLVKKSTPPRDVLAQVGLADRLDHFPAQLSGGEQQRVSVARAIVKNPRFLLCDEPTGALDYETSIMILALLKRINRETGCTVLLITHNNAIGDMADRVMRLRSGEIVEVIKNKDPLPPERIEW
ncbi:MAG TPA: ABC transporter ATP-binding protein [Syntrophomonadaceae bacterium]|nr:ABC transporter ATP-binding protein [Syntrophomonadaceae bacterium]